MKEEYQSQKILAAESDNRYRSDNFQEKTDRDSSLDPDSLISPWNPDDLVQKHNDYSLYEEMLKDDQVSVCLQLKKDNVLCSGFDIIPQEDDQEEMVEDIKVAINEDPDWPFEEMLEEMLSSYEFGFSISEKVFKRREDGKLSLKFIKTRHPGPWMIHQDEKGNIERYEQQGTPNTNVPSSVLIHMINRRKFQNPYGVPDLRAAYQAWFAKKHITRFYAVFIEKAASPIPHGKYGKEANPKAISDMYSALKKFQTKTALVTPDYMEVDFLEASSNGEAFVKGINLFNMFIGRALFIPDLLGFQGSETSGGSFSLGANQMEIFFKHINRRRAVLEKIVNDEIIWPIVVHNWGFIDNYPRFKLRPISKQDIIETAKIWLEAVKVRAWRPTEEEINHFKNIVDFPVTDEDVLEDPLEGQNEEPEPNTEPEVEIAETNDGDTEVDLSESENSKDDKREYRFKPPAGPYSAKTNFQMIENQMNSSLDSFRAVTDVMVEEILTDYKDQIAKKKIVQSEDVKKLDSIKLRKTMNLKRLIDRHMKELYRKSKETAQNEILKSGFAKPLVDQSFINLLEDENFEFIKDWEFKVSRDARLAMIQAIKDGEGLANVIDVIDLKTKKSSAVALERYARTKFTEVMNKGRLAFFEQSNVVKGYQYSAILDDRVTEICRGLHGKKFRQGNQPIPPMHFNALLEGSLIETSEGKKPIENIKVGEIVITHTGKKCEVYDTMNKFEDKEYFIIELENGKELKITGEHPVYTARGWIRADELIMTDDIICLEDI